MDDVDNIVWTWVKELLQYPENIAAGLQGMQDETVRANQALYERLDMI